MAPRVQPCATAKAQNVAADPRHILPKTYKTQHRCAMRSGCEVSALPVDPLGNCYDLIDSQIQCESDRRLTRTEMGLYGLSMKSDNRIYSLDYHTWPSRQKDVVARKKRAMRGRRLIIVDIENVAGGAVIATEQAVAARLRVDEALNLRNGEQVIIGTSHVGVIATGLGWHGPRIVTRSGKNGADLALLKVLTEERIEERFDEVVVVSGDGIFTNAVAALGAVGVRVTVAARPDACSKRLRMAATRTVFLNDTNAGIGGAA